MESKENSKKDIAFLIYQGLTPFDLIGPLSVLTRLSELNPSFKTTVVAETIEPIRGDNGMVLIPNQSFEDLPYPYAIVVPGGNTPTIKAMSNPAIRRYIRIASERAEYVGSVCTGALILASIGLLDGRETTTHWAYSGVLNSLGARYTRKRWVENGNIINSAGVSAGIDMGLFFASRLADEETARSVQIWLDYDPQPPMRIDWNRLPMTAKFMRTYMTLAAPLMVSQSKKMRKAESVGNAI